MHIEACTLFSLSATVGKEQFECESLGEGGVILPRDPHLNWSFPTAADSEKRMQASKCMDVSPELAGDVILPIDPSAIGWYKHTINK